MNKNLLIAVIVVLLLGMGSFLLTLTKQNSKPSPSVITEQKSATDTSNITDQDSVNNLVKNFYGALEAQDGKLLFSYFTQPSTTAESESFRWLTGADLPETPFYRVFIRTKILNPKIDVTEKANDTTYIVKVTDQIQGLSNAGQYAGWGSPQPRYVGLIVVKFGDKWLVDKFTDLSAKTGTDKYSGFAQGQ